jgi:radical SAM-linked protein
MREQQPPTAGVPRLYARFTYCKTGRLRWLGHLNINRALERALRRSRLPVTYSQGFNPHIKLSFAAPLPVGAEGLAELCAVDLDEPVTAREFVARLAPQLFDDLQIGEAQVLLRGRRSPFADLSRACYELDLPYQGPAEARRLMDAVERLQQADSLPVERPTKSQTLQVDIRPHVHTIGVSLESGETARLTMQLSMGEIALAKPGEVLRCLADLMGGACHSGTETVLAPVRIVRTGVE